MLVVGSGQPVEGERLTDAVLDPVGKFWVFRRPLGQPRGEIPLGFCEVPLVIEPPQLLQAVVIGSSGEVVECIS